MASGAIGSSRAKNGEPQPAPVHTQNDPAPSKRDLASWWRTFKKGSAKREEEKPAAPVGIFGVPLQTSIRYANVAISLYDDDGKSYIYGYVPIVVAKCGVFLKEKATDVEGIFRLAGSEKRIKELKVAFDSPERYGKGLDWTGYTVHDAANILRRYINKLPEPIIPLDFYEKFRAPLAPHQKKMEGSADSRVVLPSEFDYPGAIRTFKQLITELPPLNRQLLLYILDLLAVFASKSDVNKMTTTNLSSIFQPGVLSHPKNDMNPEAYFLSQDVLVFLIENQDNFLIGMQGTAADEKTVAEVQSGPPTPKLTKAQGGVARSASNSSAGAENLRKFGGVRRNASASSKRSKGSVAAASPVSPSFSNAGGVHRSNTVPSKRSPAVGPTRFSKDKVSDPPTPNSTNTPLVQTAAYPETKHLQPPAVISPSSSEGTPKPSPMVETVRHKPGKEQLVIRDMPNQTLTPEVANQAHQPVTPPAGSSSTSKTFAAVFGAKSPPADNRKPNKLQKRRGPNSANPSAHSSTHSLSGIIQDQPPSPLPQHTSFPTDAPADATPQKDANAALKPGLSPSGSLRSHPSTAGDLSGQENNEQSTEQADKEKKHRFRLSSSRIDQPPPPNASGSTLGGPVTEQSTGRRSFTADYSVASTVTTTITSNTVTSDDGGRESEKRERGPLGWVKGKLQEHKNREAEKQRAKSPPEGKQEVVSPEAKAQAEAPPAAKAQDPSPPKAEAAPAPPAES